MTRITWEWSDQITKLGLMKHCGWTRAIIWYETTWRGVALIGTGSEVIESQDNNKRVLMKRMEQLYRGWLTAATWDEMPQPRTAAHV